MKNMENGNILLKCTNEKGKNKMKAEIEKSIGTTYRVEETKLQEPGVTIANLSNELTEEDIEIGLKIQNSLEGEDDVDVVIIKKAKDNKSCSLS
ncbi:hypothetical protein HHI36_014885 [Cryptolaemus montrouzieri]|uniref:Uncharacterized protein n=1 Tax=Cryptolaemus montrouzieri TaxID=559131 RepID=A0ABD2N3Y8_9CUCU